jgi:hypothetical protein
MRPIDPPLGSKHWRIHWDSRPNPQSADSSERFQPGLRFQVETELTHPMGMQDEFFSPQQCPRPRRSPHVLYNVPFLGVRRESRGRRSVVSAEAERVRSSWRSEHIPSVHDSILSGRVEEMTGPPALVYCRDVLRVVRTGGRETRKRILHSNDALFARRTPIHPTVSREGS